MTTNNSSTSVEAAFSDYVAEKVVEYGKSLESITPLLLINLMNDVILMK